VGEAPGDIDLLRFFDIVNGTKRIGMPVGIELDRSTGCPLDFSDYSVLAVALRWTRLPLRESATDIERASTNLKGIGANPSGARQLEFDNDLVQHR
jgi:hypothetical protein